MNFVFILEIIGTIVFSFAGSLVAIERKFDIFGILVLGVTTAVGGGMFRDVLLGNIPPNIFIYPIYTIVAVSAALILIFTYKYFQRIVGLNMYSYLTFGIHILDAIGLAIFTIIGVNVCITSGYGDNAFLSVFVGVITGVGGGVLRDVLVNRIPLIFKKEIYAVASLIGAVFYYIIQEAFLPQNVAIYLSVLLISIIRLIAVKKNLNLPSIKKS